MRVAGDFGSMAMGLARDSRASATRFLKQADPAVARAAGRSGAAGLRGEPTGESSPIARCGLEPRRRRGAYALRHAAFAAPGAGAGSAPDSLRTADPVDETASGPVFEAKSEAGDVFRYTVDGEGEAVIVACVPAGDRLQVPAELGGSPVRAVGERAFAGASGLRSVSLPTGLRRVGERAFGECAALRDVALPDGLAEIGDEAFFRCDSLERIVLPDGLVSLGAGAFRGCRRLASVVFPDSLEQIRAGAFSCTSLKAVYLPERCVRVEPGALCTGPVFPGSSKLAYRSTLCEIRVHPDNPAFCLRGNALCARQGDGSLKAILFAGSVDEAIVPRGVARVASTAFAGTTRIGTLRLHEGVSFVEKPGLLPNASCDRIVIELDEPRGGYESVSIELPEGRIGTDLVSRAFSGGRIDVEALLSAYDESLLEVEDGLGQARRMAARLAAPICLAKRFRDAFARIVGGALSSVCLHFGARNYWAGFDDLASAGLLDATNIPRIVGLLSERGSALAAGYLLDLKRARFGKAAFDYAL